MVLGLSSHSAKLGKGPQSGRQIHIWLPRGHTTLGGPGVGSGPALATGLTGSSPRGTPPALPCPSLLCLKKAGRECSAFGRSLPCPPPYPLAKAGGIRRQAPSEGCSWPPVTGSCFPQPFFEEIPCRWHGTSIEGVSRLQVFHISRTEVMKQDDTCPSQEEPPCSTEEGQKAVRWARSNRALYFCKSTRLQFSRALHHGSGRFHFPLGLGPESQGPPPACPTHGHTVRGLLC